MKLPILINPRSGPGHHSAEALLGALPRELRDRLAPMYFRAPWDYLPAIEQAIAAGGPLLIWGGDGTLHHAAAKLKAMGCPVALAALPGGSGNGVVRGLRTPLDPAKALLALLAGRDLWMDLPRLDDRLFLNVCGTGFEAVVARRFEALPSRGFATYARACVEVYRTQPHTEVRWEAEGLSGPPVPTRFWNLCLANLPTNGGGLQSAPGADPTDGALQWVTLRRPSLLEIFSEAPQLFREGCQASLRTEGRFRRAMLRFEAPAPWHLDGEFAPERDRAELTVEARGFRMRVTDFCPWA